MGYSSLYQVILRWNLIGFMCSQLSPYMNPCMSLVYKSKFIEVTPTLLEGTTTPVLLIPQEKAVMAYG